MANEGLPASLISLLEANPLAFASPGCRARNEGVPGSNPGVGFPFQRGAGRFPNKLKRSHAPNPEQIPNI